jgi:peptidoglycan/LPS O-acetylase OafA/YrhL
MSGNIFYRFDPLLICLVLMGLLLVAEEFGFRAKRGTKPGSESIEKADIALILGAVLTLLALLLGFTYAMSQGRFETRRQLVVEEANAIGTTYLRAKALSEPRSSQIQELLRQYVALRVEIAKITDATPEKIREADNRTKQLHSLIWSHAAALAKASPNPIVSVFLQSLNEMIDLHSKRLAAFRNRVPFSIYLVLFIVSVITLWLVGYYFGTGRQKRRILSTMLALLVATVMWLILDLDQPARGLIRASQQSLFDLHQDLSQTSKDATKRSH